MEKTNIEHLKDIFKEIKNVPPSLTEEAEEFFEAAEKDLTDAKDKITELEEEVSGYEVDKEKEDDPTLESTFLGLDTLNWELENGNLLIQQRIEDFLEKLKKEFCVGVGYF